MSEAIAPIDPARLSQALEDINRYIVNPEDRRAAVKQFQSLTEYGPGDERGCTWQSALDNCEQVKGYFPDTTPETVFENFDGIQEEVRRIEREETPLLWRMITNRAFLVAVVVILGALVLLIAFGPRR